MADHYALTFQKTLVAAASERDFMTQLAAKMRSSGLNKQQAVTMIPTIMHLLDTPTLYYFPRDSFDKLYSTIDAQMPNSNHLEELMPTDDGLLVFQDDLIFAPDATAAYSAVAWRKNVRTYALADPGTFTTSTAILFVYRLLLADDVDGVYLSPLMFAVQENGETVVTPAYGGGDAWKQDAEQMLTRFGLICWFVQQKIAAVHTERGEVSRVVGRKKVRSSRNIRVVTLREIARTVQPSASEAHSVEWSCRWKVREHDRHLKDGRTVHVRSYTKLANRDDLPLRESERTVFNITR